METAKLENMLDTSLLTLHSNLAAKLTRTEYGPEFNEILQEQRAVGDEILRRMAAK